MLSEARRVVDAVCVAAWSAGLAVVGRARPARAVRWSSAGGRSVVVVAPHPDDEVIGCGGTILLHRRAGDRVTVVHVTDGRQSRALPLAPDAVAAHRRKEAGESLALLGVDRWEWLGCPEGEWTHEELVPRLEGLLRDARPDVVYCPSRVDYHPEHARVARGLAASLAAGSPETVMRIYQLGVPLTGILANVVADVGDVMPTVLKATAAYRSQEGAVRFSLRVRRYAAAIRGIGRAAEQFWEMPVAAYSALHAHPPTRPLHLTFRGFRRLAVLDPLAFAVGRRERRRLERLVRDRIVG